MPRRVKNVLISIGSGYHPAVRILHSMVKGASDSSILIFTPSRSVNLFDDNLREQYASCFSEFTRTFDILKKWLAKERFEVAGISFMSHHWELYVAITGAIREALPDCRIIAGGVHAWHIAPERTLEHCDYVCAAEGERPYLQLIERISSGRAERPFRIPGFIEKYAGALIRTPAGEPLPPDEIPSSTMGGSDIFHLSSVDDEPLLGQRDPQIDDSIFFVSASRGCPFRCTFCINSLAEDHRVRVKSVDKVITDLKAGLTAYRRARSVVFMDETFPLEERWLDEFTQRYKTEIGLPFQITLFPGMLTRNKLLALKKAGLKEISMGIQSGSERVRSDVYNRFDKNKRLLDENVLIAGERVMTYYDLIIRNPFETRVDYAQTIDLVSRLRRPFYLKLYTLAFFPGHPITARALAEGRITEKDADPSASYLDVTTPHRLAVVDHYPLESRLVVWYSRLLKDLRAGSAESAYCVLLSLYGIWFIPSWVLSTLKRRYDKGRTGLVYLCGNVILAVLLVRNLSLVQKFHFRYHMLRDRGLWEALRRQRARGDQPVSV